MPDFSELLAKLRNPGEDGVPENIFDELDQSYADATSTREAKITELSDAYAEKDSENLRLKSMNFDLMSAIPVDSKTDNDNDNEDDAETPRGIDSLFG